MRKNIEISDEKISEFLEQFYEYFESGYAFEEFLKVYLETIGLDEVVVTQRSSDGGIDLEAIRYGVGGFAGADAVDYYVQAKRNKPRTTIPIEKVRALRGVMPSGSKGIFITTANYSKKTEEFVNADPTRPIILIDGKALVESCIDNEIGFVFTPVFSKNAMDALKNEADDLLQSDGAMNGANEGIKLVVDKQISANDIRARILRLPKAITNLLPAEAHKVKVVFNGLPLKDLTVAKNRCYLSGVTDLYKDSGLIAEDGSYKPCKAIWKYSEDKITIVIKEH
ncbi:MAG: restriction endonuclease [Lachnospiraceae bacterium]|nr:restriction endonuclease [Lachnospiraceae bacterium]